MAFQFLSVGDILMLSQQAWKIGRAFTQGRKNAPSEFTEVEREANGLSEALKLTAETLHADGSILSRAEPETRSAVNEILESARRTLGDLDSFVERYQVIRKRETNGGFVVERSWSEAIMANYRTITWTTEGGDITELRNMLHMHTNTINLTMQALQSRSLSRLERTVMPMAENLADIHSRVNGDLGDKIDDLHRLIMSVANSTPSLVARDRLIDDRSQFESGRRSILSTLSEDGDDYEQRMLESPPVQLATFSSSKQDRQPHDSAQSTSPIVSARSPKAELLLKTPRRASGAEEIGDLRWQVESGSPSAPRRSIPFESSSRQSPSMGGMSLESRSRKMSSQRRESTTPRRESATLPTVMGALNLDDPVAETTRPAKVREERVSSFDKAASPMSKARLDSLSTDESVLPPPTIPTTPTQQPPPTPATPSSVFNSRLRSRSDTNHSLSPHTPTETTSPALSSLPAFSKSLFRNAAILCDVRGTHIEYAQKNPDEPDPRFDTEMISACQDCRICVIRKRENRAHGGTKLATSIWTLSEDGVVRSQQKLSEFLETVPYCSYFEQEKVSIPPGEEGEIRLRFHGEQWTDELEREVKTNWVNYVFVSENDAIAFQSAVFGRMLIGSFRTTKTTVLHDGLLSTFAWEEQFANIEMLRLWEDDGVATPGAQGGVMALMHISSNFGEGWARWWMNCSRQQVRVRADGEKCARLKGINIIVVRPGTLVTTGDKIRNLSTYGELQRIDTKDAAARAKLAGKKVPVKRVTGIRIEFKSEEDRDRFVLMSNRVQDSMIPLPDL